jgi:hypothetical protein
LRKYRAWAYLNAEGKAVWGKVFPDGEVPVQSIITQNATLEGIKPVQRYIKRRVEHEVFSVVFSQGGYDADNAKVRMNIGSPETPELVPSDLIKAAELGLVQAEEFSKNAVKFGWELWDNKNQTGQGSDVRVTEVRVSVGWDNSVDCYFRAFHRCFCCWRKIQKRERQGD